LKKPVEKATILKPSIQKVDKIDPKATKAPVEAP